MAQVRPLSPSEALRTQEKRRGCPPGGKEHRYLTFPFGAEPSLQDVKPAACLGPSSSNFQGLLKEKSRLLLNRHEGHLSGSRDRERFSMTPWISSFIFTNPSGHFKEVIGRKLPGASTDHQHSPTHSNASPRTHTPKVYIKISFKAAGFSKGCWGYTQD